MGGLDFFSGGPPIFFKPAGTRPVAEPLGPVIEPQGAVIG